MTEHEMRVLLAEAMGWTEIRDIPAGGLVGVPPGGGGALTPLPNPLESDSDAARLRAWCVGRGWDVSIHLRPTTAQEDGWHSVTITELTPCGGWREIGVGVAAPTDASDPLRPERLALCRAVIQALGAIEAGGGA